jgi:hypothetical protein
MVDQSAQKNPPGKAPDPAVPSAEKDLSREIERAVVREPMDQVRCVRVFGNCYRCNWWSRLANRRMRLDYDWGGLMTDYIRKSRFLTASMQTGELVIKEAGSDATDRENQGDEARVEK